MIISYLFNFNLSMPTSFKTGRLILMIQMSSDNLKIHRATAVRRARQMTLAASITAMATI